MDYFVNMKRELQRLEDGGKLMTPDPQMPIEPDPQARLTLIVWGDPQISRVSALRSARVLASCRDLSHMRTPADALIVAGDVAETGDEAEYRMFTQILCETCPDSFRHFLCVPGNHDVRMRPFRRQLDIFNRFVAGVPGGIPAGDRHYCHAVRMRGYTFLLMGTDAATFEGAFISTRQLRWLDESLARADGEPVFVVNHQTLRHINGLPHTWLGKGPWRGSVGWQSEAIREVFERYRNVIYITGHLHYCTSEFTYEDHGAFKSLSVPTVGVINHGDFSVATQGYVLSVYDDHIRARARIFGEGRYVTDRDNADVCIPFDL